VTGMTLGVAKQTLADKGLALEKVLGPGSNDDNAMVAGSNPPADRPVKKGDSVILFTGGGGGQ